MYSWWGCHGDRGGVVMVTVCVSLQSLVEYSQEKTGSDCHIAEIVSILAGIVCMCQFSECQLVLHVLC